jgi:hypothetical protein
MKNIQLNDHQSLQFFARDFTIISLVHSLTYSPFISNLVVGGILARGSFLLYGDCIVHHVHSLYTGILLNIFIYY